MTATDLVDRDALKARYRKVSGENPGVVILMKTGDFFDTYDDNAKLLASRAGLVLQHDRDGSPYCGIANRIAYQVVMELIAAGLRFALLKIEQNPSNPPTEIKSTAHRWTRDPEGSVRQSCSRCGTVRHTINAQPFCLKSFAGEANA